MMSHALRWEWEDFKGDGMVTISVIDRNTAVY